MRQQFLLRTKICKRIYIEPTNNHIFYVTFSKEHGRALLNNCFKEIFNKTKTKWKGSQLLNTI